MKYLAFASLGLMAYGQDTFEDVEPMLTTTWEQGAPYNTELPGNALIGCFGVAFGQVLKYYNYPKRGIGQATAPYCETFGSEGECNNEQRLTSTFSTTKYQWDKMPNKLRYNSRQESIAVSRLLVDVATSVNVRFNKDSSSAKSDNPNVFKNFRKHMAMADVEQKFADDYTETQWADMVKTELLAKRPVIITGEDTKSGAGHAYVFNGIRMSPGAKHGYEVHVNVGWGGYQNGWYALDRLIFAGRYSFTASMAGYFNLTPNTGKEGDKCNGSVGWRCTPDLICVDAAKQPLDEETSDVQGVCAPDVPPPEGEKRVVRFSGTMDNKETREFGPFSSIGGITVKMSGPGGDNLGAGDIDLFVNNQRKATKGAFICRSINRYTEEECLIGQDIVGDFYITTVAYTSNAEFELVIEFTVERPELPEYVYVKSGDVCAGFLESCGDDVKACSALSTGPCDASSSSPSSIIVSTFKDLAFVDSTEYLKCDDIEECPSARTISTDGDGYRDFITADDYTSIHMGTLFSTEDDSADDAWGYASVISVLNTGTEKLEWKDMDVYLAHQEDKERVVRSESQYGAPLGPFKACVSNVENGQCGTQPSVIEPFSRKYSVFGYVAGKDYNNTVVAGTNGFPQNMDKVVVRMQFETFGFDLQQLKINGRDFDEALVTENVESVTLIHSQGRMNYTFPPTYSYGTAISDPPTNPNPSPTESLFFAEVAEGGANKWVAIYNPTDDAVALSDIKVRLTRHSGSTAEITLGGTDVLLAANSQIVICNPTAVSRGNLQDGDCDIEDSTVMNYNGDDALSLLVNDTTVNVDEFTIVDVFGKGNAGGGNPFIVCGGATSEDVVLIRKQNVCGGDATELASFGTNVTDCEWIVQDVGYVEDVKFHEALCGAESETTRREYLTGVQGTADINIRVSKPSSGDGIYVDYIFDLPNENTYFLYDPDVTETFEPKKGYDGEYVEGSGSVLIVAAVNIGISLLASLME